MSTLKTSQLLRNSSAVASVGPRSANERNVLKIAAAAVFLSFAALTAAPQAVAGNPSSYEAPYIEKIPAEVVSVRKLSDRQQRDRYDRRQDQLENRSERLVQTAVGGLIGGFIGDKVGSGSGRRYARTAGAIVGGMSANRVAGWISDRRDGKNEGNIQEVTDQVLVTVAVDVGGGRQERYEIQQADVYNLRRGDQVYLMPNSDGKNVSIVPQRTATSSYRQGR